MLSLTPALSLVTCLLLCTSVSTLAIPAPLTSSTRQFNPRQKWQNDEINCIQILTPSPGATYHPGYFVRMNYGARQCEGSATAAGPWTIHLYNNPEIKANSIRYDYHEVIATGLQESRTQYLWNIPQNQGLKAVNVKKTTEYYVRVETSSIDGVRLVGNAGPFAIYPNNGPVQRRDIGGIDIAAPAAPEIINATVATRDTLASNDIPAADKLLIATNEGTNISAASVLDPDPNLQ